MKVRKVIVFDLDDTLIKELDYVYSAYREIANYLDPGDFHLWQQMVSLYHNGSNVFQFLCEKYRGTTISDLLIMYRLHKPVLKIAAEDIALLHDFKMQGHILGLISDGRSITQRNKIRAAGIENLFDKIVISDEFGSCKPSRANFLAFDKWSLDKFYIADNTSKDFIAANELGWTTICLLDDGRNIHTQDFSLSKEYLPSKRIQNLTELRKLIY